MMCSTRIIAKSIQKAKLNKLMTMNYSWTLPSHTASSLFLCVTSTQLICLSAFKISISLLDTLFRAFNQQKISINIKLAFGENIRNLRFRDNACLLQSIRKKYLQFIQNIKRIFHSYWARISVIMKCSRINWLGILWTGRIEFRKSDLIYLGKISPKDRPQEYSNHLHSVVRP